MDKISFGCQSVLQTTALYLRYCVFVLEQKIKPELEFDSLDDTKRKYFVLFIADNPIATIRYQALDEKTIQPDRFCVLKAYRKRGYGRKLLTVYEAQAKKDGHSFSQLTAEIEAVAFYQKLGYQIISEVFIEDGLLCQKMAKKL
ncbi:acetyltransferase [Enterococcus saigonensis]|uniref:Acetyltransferase n=1 Tax=Enterococcus saigonensis TaxID=1805431 RepID=A0A679ILZ6_9ENTE|nr:GNAT family N-acetyltransferase [Enterococcus saigonensis]BCA85761.1 acetyltransferase [Enterococcus saigonensis]